MKQQLKKYNNYKDSGVEWLNEIPKHWHFKRVKDLTKIISKGTTPSTEGETYTNSGVRFIKAENVNENGKVADNPVYFISEETNKILKRSQLKANDLLLVIAGATTGKTAVIQEVQLPANTNQAVCFLRLKKEEQKESLRYKYYFINSSSFQSLIWLYAVTSAQPNLPMAILGRIDFCYPPLKEQTQIANYLDVKTTAIDKKVKLLQQKIKHYKAYRKTLINETVTKGLDKTVKLKDSGIDWIGEIPEHWEVKRYKSFGKTIKGKNMEMSDIEFDNSLPLLSLEYLRNESVQHPTFCYSSDKSLKSTDEDLVIVWDGAAVGEILKSKVGYVSSTIAKLDINKKKFNTRYFYHLRGAIDYKLKQIPTGMGIPHLNPTLFRNFKCPSPPIKEQQQIANYLDTKTAIIDKIVRSIETQIATLKELRKTLINEVVTGKVKVSA
jgi:type I restriction enzyme S subunit